MKFHNLRKKMASLMALLCMVVCCSVASAQDAKLYIPDIKLDNYDPVDVNIMLDNQIEIQAFSFKVDLPAGVEIVPNSAVKTNRYNQGQQFMFRNNTFACISMQLLPFTGNSGSVGTFQVKATPGSLGDEEKKLSLRLYDMSIVAQDHSKNITISEQTTTVTTIDNSDPVNLVLSYEQSASVVNPSGELKVTVALDNDAPVQGMQMQIVLPEGFEFVKEGNNIFTQTSRMSGGATITPRTNGNITRVVISDLVENQILSAGSGAFMSFSVAAPANFDTQNAVILIENVEASVKYKTVKIDSLSIPFNNGKVAYDKALAEVTTLETALADALQTIAADCADVKDLFPGTEISERIEALKSAIEAAYSAGTLTDDYDEVMAPAAEISAAIAQLVEDAKAAQASHDADVAAELARQEAYKNGTALVAQLNSELAAALETIANDCPDVKDNFKGEDISTSIENLQKALDAALEDKTIVENYDNIVAPATEISAAIATLIENAKAAQKAFEEEKAAAAALEAALEKATAQISTLRQLLNEALQTIAADCADVKDLFPGTEIESQIKALESAVQAAYEGKTLATNYDEVMAPTSEISAAIAELVKTAKEAQASHDAEVAAELARQEAYKNGTALVAQLNSELAAALQTIANDCPNVKDNFKGEDITTSIENLQKALDAALADKTIVENYDNLVAPAQSISAAILKLIEDAKAAQKAYDDAENAAKEAYKNGTALVAQLNSELAAALQTIATDCPDVKDNFKGEAISTSIENLQKALDAALENKTIVENYDNIVAPAQSISAAIAKLIEDAKAAQKAYEENAALEAARVKANAALAALDKALADALAEIDKDCPDVKHLYTGAYIQQQITVLRNAVNAAYDDKTLAANYDEVMTPVTTIEESIAKLLSDAKAAQKAVEDAENARKEYNTKAYEADLALIAELQNKLDAAKIEIIENYPDYNYTPSYDKIAAAIAALKAKADKEYERVADEGKYSYSVDTLMVEEMIEKMLAEARTTGIDLIFSDDVNSEDRIFTLDGKQVPTLQHGKVNIIVKANGTKQKVYIK